MRILVAHIYFTVIIKFSLAHIVITDDDELLMSDEPSDSDDFSGSGENTDENYQKKKNPKDDPCRHVRNTYNTAMQHKEFEYRSLI